MLDISKPGSSPQANPAKYKLTIERVWKFRLVDEEFRLNYVANQSTWIKCKNLEFNNEIVQENISVKWTLFSGSYRDLFKFHRVPSWAVVSSD